MAKLISYISVILLLVCAPVLSIAQCTSPSANTGGTTSITPSTSWQTVVFKSGAVRYIDFTATVGNTYFFSASSVLGGSCAGDEQFSMLNSSNVAQGGVFSSSFVDSYGSGTKELFSWSPSTTGTYRIVMSLYSAGNCKNLAADYTVAYVSIPATTNFDLWLGTSSTDWGTSSNWIERSTCCTPSGWTPSSSDDVFIPSGTSNMPTISTYTDGSCNNLTINSGATLTASMSTIDYLEIYGNLVNNGTINHTTSGNCGTSSIYPYIIMKGSGVTMGGTGDFTNCAFLMYSSTNTSVTLSSNISCSKLYIDDGAYKASLSLGSYYLTLTNGFNQAGTLNLNTGTIEIRMTTATMDVSDFHCNTGTFYENMSTSTSIGISPTFYDYKINCSSGTFSIGANQTVTHDFTIVGGTIDGATYTMNISRNFINNGTLTYSTSTFNFNGSSAQQIQGTSASTFYNLTLNNSAGLSLAPSAGLTTTVRHTLTLTSGCITLGNFDLAIGATGLTGTVSGATSTNFIVTNGTGGLKNYNIGTGAQTSVAFPIGISTSSYSPVTLAVSGTSTTDNFKAIVSQSVLASGTSGSAYTTNVVDKTWNITEGTVGGSSLTLTLQWPVSTELTSFSRSLCYVSHYSGGVWGATEGLAAASGAGPYTRVSGIVTSFSPFAVGSNGLLPIELTEFTAKREGNESELNWITASEDNNDKFVIQRSLDGNRFDSIGAVKGNGKSTSSRNYHFYDSNPAFGLNYYRLKQCDFDGNYSFSAIRNVEFKEQQDLFSVQPNPTKGDLIINYKKFDKQSASELDVFDLNGKSVKHIDISGKSTEDLLKVDISDIDPGIYFIYFSQNGQTFKEKIIKE